MIESSPNSQRSISSAFHDQEKRIHKEIQHLLGDILRIEPKNENWCTFGDLFTDPLVEQYYEALVGTMKAAKRKGLIKFDGQFLLKGMHDHVIITLMDDGDNQTPRRVANEVDQYETKHDSIKNAPAVSKKVASESPSASVGSKPSVITVKSNEVSSHLVTSIDAAQTQANDATKTSSKVKEGSTPDNLHRLSIDTNDFFSPLTSVESVRSIPETPNINDVPTPLSNYESPNHQTITNLNTHLHEEQMQDTPNSTNSKKADLEENESLKKCPGSHSSSKSKRKKTPKTQITMEEGVLDKFMKKTQNDTSVSNRSHSSQDSKKEDRSITADTVATAPVTRSTYSFTEHKRASERESTQVKHTATAGVAFHSKSYSESHAERVEREVNQVLVDIRRIIPEGSPHCTFGDLFTDPIVEQYYEALVGTLKSAKRKGLIKFKGQILLKGIHDNVEINIIE